MGEEKRLSQLIKGEPAALVRSLKMVEGLPQGQMIKDCSVSGRRYNKERNAMKPTNNCRNSRNAFRSRVL